MFTDRCEEDMPFLERSLEELGWIKSKSCLLITGTAGMKFIENLLKRFPKLRIIATDKEPHLIDSARLYNASENVTYCVADIEKRETLKYWFGTARKILSYHNLEGLTDVKVAFDNFYNLLAPEGTIAVRFSPQHPVFNWMKEVSFRWRQFVRHSVVKSLLPVTEDSSDICFQDMLRSIGFEILYFGSVKDCSKFESEEHCKKFLISCCLSLFDTLPVRMKSGFVDDMFHRFAKYSTRSDQGDIEIKCRVLEIFLKKPKIL